MKSQSVLHTYPEGGVFRHVFVGVEIEVCPNVVSVLEVASEPSVFEADSPGATTLPREEYGKYWPTPYPTNKARVTATAIPALLNTLGEGKVGI